MDMNTNAIEDFSDLGKPIQFSYDGVNYYIPAVTNVVAKKLIKIGRDISKRSKEIEDKIKEFEESKQQIPEELEEETSRVFDFQIDFALQAGLKTFIFGENGKEKIFSEIDPNYISEIWPNRLTAKVFALINESMSQSSEDKEKKL